MDYYTVTFIGHRYIYEQKSLIDKIIKTLDKVVSEKRKVEILVGDNGDFDRLAAATVRLYKRQKDIDIPLVLVLSYNKKNVEYYEKYYDEIEICEESANAYFKAAIGIRNRYMIDRSDMVIGYVEQDYGGAYRAFDYAIKSGKEIINLANCEI